MSNFTFFSEAHGTFSKIDHMLCHKAVLRKCKKIEILLCVPSDHNGLRIEINDKIKERNYSNTWRLNNRLFNETRITKNIREEIKKFLEVNENDDTTY